MLNYLKGIMNIAKIEQNLQKLVKEVKKEDFIYNLHSTSFY